MSLNELLMAGPWESTERLVLSMLVLALSAMLQATLGFAAGVLGIPLLMWSGNSLPEAQLMIITAMLPQNLLGLWRLRSHVTLREIAWPGLIRVLCLPLGLLGMSTILVTAPHWIDPLIGTLILVAVVTQWVRGSSWPTAGRWYWVLPTFGLSGLLQGLTGMSAPPMVLWLQGQRLPADKSRAFLFSMYLISFLPQLCLMLWGFGPTMLSSGLVSVAALPLVLIAAAIGLRFGTVLGEHRLRPAIYLLLIWMALTAILT
jgi:uncharacterized protein